MFPRVVRPEIPLAGNNAVARNDLVLFNGDILRLHAEIAVAVFIVVHLRFRTEHRREAGNVLCRRHHKTVDVRAAGMLRVVLRITVCDLKLDKAGFALDFPRQERVVRETAEKLAVEGDADGPTAEKPDVARNVFRNRNAESQDRRGGIGDLAVRADHIAAQSLFARPAFFSGSFAQRFHLPETMRSPETILSFSTATSSAS